MRGGSGMRKVCGNKGEVKDWKHMKDLLPKIHAA